MFSMEWCFVTSWMADFYCKCLFVGYLHNTVNYYNFITVIVQLLVNLKVLNHFFNLG
jgi:hypothetical protein